MTDNEIRLGQEVGRMQEQNKLLQLMNLQLKQQIEQMKNCHNCNKYSNELNTISSNCFGCKNKSKWELAE